MTAGDLAVVLAAVLCCIGFAALIVVLLASARHDAFAAQRGRVVAAGDRSVARRVAFVDSRGQGQPWQRRDDDLERFDRVLGSAEAISGAVAGGSRVARAALSTPMIKTAALATGTTRAVRRFRRKERRSA